MNGSKIFRFRLERRFATNALVAAILMGFLTVYIVGCGNKANENKSEFKKIDGRVEPMAYKTSSGPSITLAIKKEIHLPYLEVEARLAPSFELPRRLRGNIFRLRVRAVKMDGDLDIYDKDHAFEKNLFASVVWLNFDQSQGLWVGRRQVYLRGFRTIALKSITSVDGAMLLMLPVDPVAVLFNLKDYGGRYEIKGIRFEIEHLSSKKVELLILGSDKNYMGMDARVKGKWLQTLGVGRSFSKSLKDQIIIEEHRISVNFPQPVEAIKLYFCSDYTPVQSDIYIQPDTLFTKKLNQ